MNNQDRINALRQTHTLTHEDWVTLLDTYTKEDQEMAAAMAREISLAHFGNHIYLRGIVEFSNICKCDCYYCGIRKSNANVSRYRLSADEILECCIEGYDYGYRTFVLQSGEDSYFTIDKMADIVSSIKEKFTDCAITLSIGELTKEAYQTLFDAGADRYLLRHETADQTHYQKLHPAYQSFDNRMNCLKWLKEIGYQTGCGFMVGSPYQTTDCIAKDMEFMSEFKPHMIGIGPFLPHKDTPFRKEPAGSFELTLFLLSLCRIMHPTVLLPATTALGTIHPKGRELGVLAGANVIMPNLSPTAVRKKYMLYDNKICTEDKSEECRHCIKARMKSIGYEVIVSRGDYSAI